MQQIEKATEPNNYQIDFVCTYQLITDEEEAEILYQTQFLQAFNLEVFDDKTINSITDKLYKKFGTSELIVKLMSYYDSYWDAEIRFRLCFSYGTFYVIHRILCALILEEKLPENTIDILFNKIKI